MVLFLFVTWEQRKLREVFDYERPDTYIVKSDKYSDTYSTPVLTANKGFILGYTNEMQVCNKECIIFDDFTLDSKYVTFPFMVKSSALKILTAKIGYFLPFAYQLLQATNIEILGHARHYISVVQPTKVLIPSNDEQIRIGKCIQQIDNLITLHQRKEFLSDCYSDIFNAEDKSKKVANAWEQRKLKSMTSVITKGTTPLDKSNTGNVNFIKIENINNFSGEISITQRISAVEHEGYLRRSKLKENDILFSIAGTLGRVTAIKASILPANTNQAVAIIRLKEGVLNYIKTFLKGKAVVDFIRKNPTVGAQPNLSLEQVGALEIQVPDIQEQTAIGDFFEQLDNLITLHQRKLKDFYGGFL